MALSENKNHNMRRTNNRAAHARTKKWKACQRVNDTGTLSLTGAPTDPKAALYPTTISEVDIGMIATARSAAAEQTPPPTPPPVRSIVLPSIVYERSNAVRVKQNARHDSVCNADGVVRRHGSRTSTIHAHGKGNHHRKRRGDGNKQKHRTRGRKAHKPRTGQDENARPTKQSKKNASGDDRSGDGVDNRPRNDNGKRKSIKRRNNDSGDGDDDNGASSSSIVQVVLFLFVLLFCLYFYVFFLWFVIG